MHTRKVVRKGSALHLALGALLGVAVGGAVAGGVFFLVLTEREKRHQEEVAMLSNRLALPGPVNSATGKPAAKKTSDSEEDKIMELGKAFVADLENNRLASAYRSTTASYQQKMERKAFDEMIGKNAGIRRLDPTENLREQKLRKSADDKQEYEFYYTARDLQAPGGLPLVVGSGRGPRVNFALIWRQEDGAWKVKDVEVSVEP